MLNQVEITVLADNHVDSAFLLAEPGLSLHISSPEGNFLFDTGFQDVFLHNAEKLSIDLGIVDKIIFSHGHRDHTGGIEYYLKQFGAAQIICHYNLFNRRFRVTKGGKVEVGIPYDKSALTKMGGNFVYKSNEFAVTENILLSGEISRRTAYEKQQEIHQELVIESYITDKLKDDMSLILKTVKGLIVLLGDAHSGPVNTVLDAIKKTGERRIYAIMGGMGLTHTSSETIKRIARGIQELAPEFVIPLHSTGFRANNIFYNLMPETVQLLNTGCKLTLDGVQRPE